MALWKLNAAMIQYSLEAIDWADKVLSSSFVYRIPRDLILDSILGPAEDFKYVSSTAPHRPSD